MPIPRKTAIPRNESHLPKSTPDRAYLSLRIEKLDHGQDRYLSERVVPLPRVPVRPLPDWWLDSGSRAKPEAWAQPFRGKRQTSQVSDQELSNS
jgi:hypothetical protein